MNRGIETADRPEGRAARVAPRLIAVRLVRSLGQGALAAAPMPAGPFRRRRAGLARPFGCRAKALDAPSQRMRRRAFSAPRSARRSAPCRHYQPAYRPAHSPSGTLRARRGQRSNLLSAVGGTRGSPPGRAKPRRKLNCAAASTVSSCASPGSTRRAASASASADRSSLGGSRSATEPAGDDRPLIAVALFLSGVSALGAGRMGRRVGTARDAVLRAAHDPEPRGRGRRWRWASCAPTGASSRRRSAAFRRNCRARRGPGQLLAMMGWMAPLPGIGVP
jgi:hypothetical protein